MDVGDEHFAADDARVDPFVAFTYDGNVARFGFAQKHFGAAAVVFIELVNVFVAHGSDVQIALRIFGESHGFVDVERSEGLYARIADGDGDEAGIEGVLNQEQTIFAFLPKDGRGFGDIADPEGGMGGMGRAFVEGGFVDTSTNTVCGIKHLGDGVVGAILNLLDAADGFGADQVARGIVNHHTVGVEDEHRISDGQFVESDVSGRF